MTPCESGTKQIQPSHMMDLSTLPRAAVRGVLFGGTLEAAASKLLGLANLIWMVVSNMFFFILTWGDDPS